MAQNKKNQTKNSAKAEAERLTNQYMIQLSLGVLGIIVLYLILRGYMSASTISAMQTVTWVLTGVFAIITILLAILGATGKIKNKTRAFHYAIFTGICCLISLWLSLYNKINSLLWDMNIKISSYWSIYIPMIAIGIYLLVALVVLIIRIARK